jgi:hypothetical protein
MLTVEQVKDLIEKKDTRIATITFIKADGSTRVVNGLFKPTSKMVGSDRGLAQGEAMKARGQVPIWSLQEKSWKSFMLDKVLEIK